MELSSLQLDVDDSISFGWLADAVGHSMGTPRSDFIDMYPDNVRRSLGRPGSSFIDIYPDELFTMRWTTAAASDFEFDLPVVPNGTVSPVLLASPSRITSGGGLLLPCEPGDAPQEHGDGADVAPSVPQRSESSSPLFDLIQRRTPSSCSGAMRDAGSKLGSRQSTVCACGTSSFSPPWKVLPSCLRFSGMLYRKVSTLRQRPRDAAACPTIASTSSAIEWCHGSANTAVDDAILYCKKSSGQDILST